jgi:hypothetical protein
MADTAKIILEQLGGAGRLRAMTGAYNFQDTGSGLSFRIKNPKANCIKVTLTRADLYDVEVGRIRGGEYTVVKRVDGLYDDQLKSVIEKATGMRLSMGFADGGEVQPPFKFTFKTNNDLARAEAKGYVEEYDIVRFKVKHEDGYQIDFPAKTEEDYVKQLREIPKRGGTILNVYQDKMYFDIEEYRDDDGGGEDDDDGEYGDGGEVAINEKYAKEFDDDDYGWWSDRYKEIVGARPKMSKEELIQWANDSFRVEITKSPDGSKIHRQLIYKGDSKIVEELKSFDLSNLDPYESMLYEDFIKQMPKHEALQLIINNVEGDYSQLDPELAAIAEKQDVYAGGGMLRNDETEIELTPSIKEKIRNYALHGGGINRMNTAGAEYYSFTPDWLSTVSEQFVYVYDMSRNKFMTTKEFVTKRDTGKLKDGGAVYDRAAAISKDVMLFGEFKKRLPEINSPYAGENGVYKSRFDSYTGVIAYFKYGRKNSDRIGLADAYSAYLYQTYHIDFKRLPKEEKERLFGSDAKRYRFSDGGKVYDEGAAAISKGLIISSFKKHGMPVKAKDISIKENQIVVNYHNEPKNIEEAFKDIASDMTTKDYRFTDKQAFFFYEKKMADGGTVSGTYSTIASFDDFNVTVYKGRLGYKDILNKCGKTPKNIRHIEIKAGSESPFVDWSKREVRKKFKSDFKEGYPVYSSTREHDGTVVDEAIGQLKNNQLVKFDAVDITWVEMMGKGGVTFEDKVKAIKGKLKGSKVPRRYQSQYGRRYSSEDAEAAARRIAGSMIKK